MPAQLTARFAEARQPPEMAGITEFASMNDGTPTSYKIVESGKTIPDFILKFFKDLRLFSVNSETQLNDLIYHLYQVTNVDYSDYFNAFSLANLCVTAGHGPSEPNLASLCTLVSGFPFPYKLVDMYKGWGKNVLEEIPAKFK